MMDNPIIIRQLHTDLQRRWANHGTSCRAIWASLGKKERESVMRAGAMDGVVLKSPRDPTLGNVVNFFPEWNLEDCTKPSSMFLIDLIEYRATRSLVEQYIEGVGGGLGDYHHILEHVMSQGLRLAQQPTKDTWTLFIDGPEYGTSYTICDERARVGFKTAIERNVCIPKEVGSLVLNRQGYLLQLMNIVIEDILDAGNPISPLLETKKSNKKPQVVSAATGKEKPFAPQKRTISELVSLADDYVETTKDYLNLMLSTPALLAHHVNLRFFSQSELLADDRGRRLPYHTDNYISPIFLETLYAFFKEVAVWTYMARLLRHLEAHTSDKLYRPIIFQELSNVLHIGFTHSLAEFRRNVQCHNSNAFKRVGGDQKDSMGAARAVIKGKPNAYLQNNPQLSHMLQLCQPSVSFATALPWLVALEAMHTDEDTWRNLSEGEVIALNRLGAFASVHGDIAASLALPPQSRKKGAMFAAKYAAFDADIARIRSDIDLSEYVAPIDNLSFESSARKALAGLDEYLNRTLGATFDLLYQEIMDECMAELERQYQGVLNAKREAEEKKMKVPEWVPLPSLPEEERAVVIARRREKLKTRPATSILRPPSDVQGQSETRGAEDKLSELSISEKPVVKLQVNKETAAVFDTIFGKKDARGSVSWAQFEKAMSNVGFTVVPKFGSVVQFQPKAEAPVGTEIGKPGVVRAITFHRPHKSKVEGMQILWYARRLQSVYGWGGETFEVVLGGGEGGGGGGKVE